MKKQLLTSTALVAAGLVAFGGTAIAKPKLSVGGYSAAIFGVGENTDAFDAATNEKIGWDVQSDGEIHFNGSAKLDNGIKIKTRVELEANQDNDQIDEHWMRVSGSFGEIRFGSMDDAARSMTIAATASFATGVGLSLQFDTGRFLTNPGTVGTSTVALVTLSNDAEQVAYYTPRMSGFQLGASYIPHNSQDSNGSRENTTTADTDLFAVGANYVSKMGGASVRIAAGYVTGQESNTNRDDPEEYGIGASIGMDGMKFALSYVDAGSQDTPAGVTVTQGQETFEAGVSYGFGPNAISFVYQDAEADASVGNANNGDKHTIAQLAYRRILGPGVDFSVTATSADFDDGLAAAATSNSNDGESVAGRLRVKF